jgi:hypothetical protein
MLSVKTPFQERAEAVKAIQEWMKKFFAREPKWNSLLLCVAQFWNDEADDATHFELIASTKKTPSWIFDSEADVSEEQTSLKDAPREDCHVYSWDSHEELGNFPLDRNSSAVRPFQSLCCEGAFQETDLSAAYLPAYVFRKDGSVDFIGEIVRPWLDLPRAFLPSWIREQSEIQADADGNKPGSVPVPFALTKKDITHLNSIAQSENKSLAVQIYADALLSKGDKRGTYISLCNTPKKTAESEIEKQKLLFEHGEKWLSDLIHVVPISTADLSTGVMTACTPHFDSGYEKYIHSPLFSTVTSLHCASGEPWLLDSMTSLTSLTGLVDMGALQKFAHRQKLKHVAIRNAVAILELANMSVAKLNSLDIETSADGATALIAQALSSLPQLQELRILNVPYGSKEMLFLNDFVKLLGSECALKHIALATSSSGWGATGFQLSMELKNPNQIELSCLGLCHAARPAALEAHLKNLPAMVREIHIIESIHFTPSDSDRKQMAQWSNCQIV